MRLYFSILNVVFISGFLSCFQSVFGQDHTVEFSTIWDTEAVTCHPCQYNTSSGELTAFNTALIPFRGEHDFSHEITVIETEQVKLPAGFNADLLPADANIEVGFGKARHENRAIVSYHPIIRVGGITQIVKKIKVDIHAESLTTTADREAFFAPVSVLASGNWYKIGVAKEGVYKLDYEQLNMLGVSVEGLNPNHINLFGNQTPALPVYNDDWHPDDLMKNAIYVSGDSDGSFDPGDYVLFYAKGPDVETMDVLGEVDLAPGHHDSLAYFFLTVNSSISPSRITSISNSGLTPTHTATQSPAAVRHEANLENLLKSGKRWFGEHFDIELSHSFSFTLDGADLAIPVKLKAALASADRIGGLKMRIRVNGSEVMLIETSKVTGQYTVATWHSGVETFLAGSTSLSVTVDVERSSPASEAWLDYLQFNYTRNNQMSTTPLKIQSPTSVGAGNVTRFVVGSWSGADYLWEISNPREVRAVQGSVSGTTLSFTQPTDTARVFYAFNSSQFLQPVIQGPYLGKIANQNLHGLPQADYLIITHETLRDQANRLADLHRANGVLVHVVDIQNVYNEFGGGAADPVAVRWMAKMFYDRSAADPSHALRSLCLFGDGTFDPLNRIENNNYLLPTYNSEENGVIHYTNSFTSDDFFGLLDDTEAMTKFDLLDIGVGRMPVSDLQVAEQVVNKIEHYMRLGSTLYQNVGGVQCGEDGYTSILGDWRNRMVLIADDEDSGKFIYDCESASDTVNKNHPEMNIEKIYFDAYKQIVTSGGQRYPDVEEAINQNINKGALLFNYVGHGGETGLSLERAIDIPMIQAWTNIHKLPVFVSATCEFSRFDDPGRVSAGETMLTSPHGGAVAMLTTTRLVSIGLNSDLVNNLYTVVFQTEDGKPLRLGDIIRQAKNKTAGGDNHMRNFTLLGDPELRLGRPQPLIVTDSVNHVAVDEAVDTLKALSRITVSGHVENGSGILLSAYNGVVYPTVFDKSKERLSLGQDPDSPVIGFNIQNNVLYKGKSTVKNGYFTFTFIVPKDIDYSFGPGKISYYAANTSSDQYGYDTTLVVGGVDPNGIGDDRGPEIELFMNNEHFVNGGITDNQPVFLAHVRDESGINTTGNGIGHNITLTLDDNTANPVILNNFYEADLDTYQSGKVSYPLSNLKEGPHRLTFKVWDVNNNSAEKELEFTVVGQEKVGISHLLNYPNPFTTRTAFYFEHNQVCNDMDVRLEIFTVSGKLVKTITKNVHSNGFRSEGMEWDGRDDFGDRLARGVYVYRLSIENERGEKAEKIEKLVIL